MSRTFRGSLIRLFVVRSLGVMPCAMECFEFVSFCPYSIPTPSLAFVIVSLLPTNQCKCLREPVQAKHWKPHQSNIWYLPPHWKKELKLFGQLFLPSHPSFHSEINEINFEFSYIFILLTQKQKIYLSHLRIYCSA